MKLTEEELACMEEFPETWHELIQKKYSHETPREISLRIKEKALAAMSPEYAALFKNFKVGK